MFHLPINYHENGIYYDCIKKYQVSEFFFNKYFPSLSKTSITMQVNYD